MPVELGYFTLKVADVPRAKNFYGALFGWTFTPNGHIDNTKFHMGLAPGGPAEVPFAYFKVADLEATVAQLIGLGGTVRGRAVNPSGPNAECSDDQGTVFTLWQPNPGFE